MSTIVQVVGLALSVSALKLTLQNISDVSVGQVFLFVKLNCSDGLKISFGELQLCKRAVVLQSIKIYASIPLSCNSPNR